jgi:hypothetical protein
LIPCPKKFANNIEEAWYSPVGTVLSPLRHLHIIDPGLKWDCADGFQRQCYHLLATWVGDSPEQDILAEVSDGLCQMCVIPEGAPMGYSTF